MEGLSGGAGHAGRGGVQDFALPEVRGAAGHNPANSHAIVGADEVSARLAGWARRGAGARGGRRLAGRAGRGALARRGSGVARGAGSRGGRCGGGGRRCGRRRRCGGRCCGGGGCSRCCWLGLRADTGGRCRLTWGASCRTFTWCRRGIAVTVEGRSNCGRSVGQGPFPLLRRNTDRHGFGEEVASGTDVLVSVVVQRHALPILLGIVCVAPNSRLQLVQGATTRASLVRDQVTVDGDRRNGSH